MKPFFKLAGAFAAGFLVCLAWNYLTQNRYTIVSDKYGQQTLLNQRTGDTWTQTESGWIKIGKVNQNSTVRHQVRYGDGRVEFVPDAHAAP